MRSLFFLAALTLALSSTIAAARTADSPSGPTVSGAQMSQCTSPDPSRAIIGCTAIINASGPPELKSDAYSLRGMAYEKRGENDKAIADHNQAVKVYPKNANALRGRGAKFQCLGTALRSRHPGDAEQSRSSRLADGQPDL